MLAVEDIFKMLQDMRKGEGLSLKRASAHPQFVQAFGDGSATKAVQKVREHAEKLPPSPTVTAALNALAIGFPISRNTTDRREKLLKAHYGVFGTDLRNLMRQEDKGLEEIALVLYELQDGATQPRKNEDEATDMELGVNQQTIEFLADTIAKQQLTIKNLIDKLGDLAVQQAQSVAIQFRINEYVISGGDLSDEDREYMIETNAKFLATDPHAAKFATNTEEVSPA